MPAGADDGKLLRLRHCTPGEVDGAPCGVCMEMKLCVKHAQCLASMCMHFLNSRLYFLLMFNFINQIEKRIG